MAISLDHCAAVGACEVVCLEPSAAGSNPRMEKTFRDWGASLDGPTNGAVKLVRQDLQKFPPETPTEVFDLVVIQNAINHLDEDACRRLPHDKEARERYIAIFAGLYQITAPGGWLIMADAARRNAWNLLGLHGPLSPRRFNGKSMPSRRYGHRWLARPGSLKVARVGARTVVSALRVNAFLEITSERGSPTAVLRCSCAARPRNRRTALGSQTITVPFEKARCPHRYLTAISLRHT